MLARVDLLHLDFRVDVTVVQEVDVGRLHFRYAILMGEREEEK